VAAAHAEVVEQPARIVGQLLHGVFADRRRGGTMAARVEAQQAEFAQRGQLVVPHRVIAGERVTADHPRRVGRSVDAKRQFDVVDADALHGGSVRP
jgi:hypothetical protein